MEFSSQTILNWIIQCRYVGVFCHAMALKDVSAAIDGNTEPPEEAMMEGRIFIPEADRELFLQGLEEAVVFDSDHGNDFLVWHARASQQMIRSFWINV